MNSNGKSKFQSAGTGEKFEQNGMSASRARNRTVMLSPEMTGQVRALLQNGEDNSDLLADDGFQAPTELPVNETAQFERPEVTAGFKAPFSEEHFEAEDLGHFGGKVGKHTTLTDFTRAQMPVEADKVRESFDVIPRAEKEPTELVERPKLSNRSTGLIRRPVVPISQERQEKQEKIEPLVSKSVAAKKHNSRIIGFLISFDKDQNGEVLEIREGRFLISSEATNRAEEIIINDPSISSPFHAVIKASQDGDVILLDQLSEFGSGIVKRNASNEQDASGVAIAMSHGDLVRLGKRYFVYCAVPRIEIKE